MATQACFYNQQIFSEQRSLCYETLNILLFFVLPSSLYKTGNHDDEANYQQGYHDAIEQALDWFSNYLDYLNMGICDENDWLRGSPESGKERFIKAMEEYI